MIDKKKKRALIVFLVAFFVVAFIAVLMLQSSVNYKVMSYKEQIMSQIKEEQQVYSDSIFEEVNVIRPWYSLDPTKWIYKVIFKDNGEEFVYEYDNGTFLQIN